LKAARAEAEKWAKNAIQVKVEPKLDRTALTAVKAQIEKVTGNVKVKVSLDNSSLQAVKQRIDRTVGNVKVRANLDQSSLAAIRSRINSAVGSIKVRANLDQSSLTAIRARINSAVGSIKVRANLDQSTLAAIRARINSAVGTINVKLRLEAGEIAAIRARIDAIRPVIRVRVDVDQSALSRLNGMTRNLGSSFGGVGNEMRAVIALLPLLLSVGAPAINGLIGLLGGLGSAISIVGSGLGAFGLVAAGVFSTISQHAEKTKTATAGISSAYDQVASARERLTQVIEQSAHQNEQAEQRVAEAREQLSRTVEQAARDDVAAEERVTDARKNLAKITQDAARDNVAAQERVADAEQNVIDAVEQAARANEDAKERIQDAQEAVAKAVEDAARANEAANKRIISAQKDVARAVEDAAQANVQAQRRVESAEHSLTRTQEQAKRAQEDLNKARKDAIEDLEDLRLALRGGALDEEQAILDLAEAQKRFNAARAEGADADDLKQYELDVRKAQLALDESRESYGDLKEKAAEYSKTGIEGSEGVRNAQDKVKSANEDVADAERDLADARTEATNTAIEGQQKVQEAQEKVAEAQQEATQTALDGQRSIQEAQEEVVKAQKEATQTALDGQKSIQKAQEDLAKAQREAAQTAVEGQERILEAQEEVSRAQREAAQTALDGQRDIADAQKAVAEAEKEQARVALENSRQIAAATRDLANAQRDYNSALGEMPKKLLPGYQLAYDALERLKASYQGLMDRTSPAVGAAMASVFDGMTAALNTLDPIVNATSAAVERMGKNLQQYFRSADWQQFVNFLSQHVGPTLDKVFAAVGNLMGGLKGLVVAFQPLADWILDKIVKGLEDFNTWANNLANDPNFQKWIEDVKVDLQLLWEILVQVVTFIAHLVRDLEPLGRPVMQGLIAALDFLNKLPPGMLGAIAMGITAIMTALILGAGGPVALGIGAITAAATGLVYLYQTSDTAKAKMDEFVTWLKNIWNPIWETIKNNFEQYIKPAFDKLSEAALKLWNTLVDVGKTIVEKVQPYLQPLADVLTQHVIPAFLDLLTKLTELITFLTSVFGPVFGDIFGRVVGILTGALEVMSGAIETFIGLVTGDWDKFGKGLQTITEGFWTIIAGVFGMTLDELKAKMTQWDQDITAAWNAFWAGFKSTADGGSANTQNAFTIMLDNIKGYVDTKGNEIQSAWSSFLQIFKQDTVTNTEDTRGVFERFMADVNRVIDDGNVWIKQTWSELGTWFSGVGTDFLEWVKKRFAEFGPWCTQRIQEAADGIGKAWRAVANFFREPINWVIRVVINDGILNSWNTVMGWIGAAPLTATPMAELPTFATGGMVQGPGTGTSDSVLARVSAGEFIVPASVARANMDLLAALPRFQSGGFVPPGGTLGTGQVGATTAPGTTGTGKAQSWWDRVGVNATALFNSIIAKIPSMPRVTSLIGQAIARIPDALVKVSLDTLKNKLSNMFPPAVPGAENLSPYNQDPRFSQTLDKGGILRSLGIPINTSGHAERVLSPTQTQDFNQFVQILQDMFHPTKTKAPSGGDIYHITLPPKATIRELANEIAFRKKVAAKGRYTKR
jgi:phage-related protein